MNPSFKRGFTLIELLVVIAIIAILAAILFPVFATAREKARQTGCLSNMRQIGLALTQYEQDYDEINPGGANFYGQGNGWAAQLYTYVKAKGAFICPSDTYTLEGSSFGMNSNLAKESGGGVFPTIDAPTGIGLSKMTAPSSTVMFFEIQGNGGVQAGTPMYDMTGNVYTPYTVSMADIHALSSGTPPLDGYSAAGRGLGNAANELNGEGASTTTNGICQLVYATGYMINSATSATYFKSPTGRHSDGSNFVLADGHVKWLKPSTVSAGYSPGTATNCGGGSTAAGTSCTTLASGAPVAATFSAT